MEDLEFIFEMPRTEEMASFISIKGEKGDKGDPTATIEINDVTTGEAGTDAKIENVGTNVNMKLNITIPRGEKGETGETGEAGQEGSDVIVSETEPTGEDRKKIWLQNEKMWVKNSEDIYEEFISKKDTLENYSTEEQVIGIWIDDKPLYRKVIQQSFDFDWTDISLAELNADTIFINYGKTYAKFTVGENQYINGQFYAGDTDFFRAFIVNTSTLTVAFAPEMTNRTAVITVEYTKTTD